MGSESLFLNKFSASLDANQWAKDYWPRILKTFEIRPRKFSATCHTFIIEAVKRGEVLKAIADYVSSSVQMIEEHYCGTLTLSDQTVFEPRHSKTMNSLASPTGFEPNPGDKVSSEKKLVTTRRNTRNR